MIQLKCPSCGHGLAIDEKYAGQKGSCKQCGGAIRVPQPFSTDPDNIENLDIDPDKATSSYRPVVIQHEKEGGRSLFTGLKWGAGCLIGGLGAFFVLVIGLAILGGIMSSGQKSSEDALRKKTDEFIERLENPRNISTPSPSATREREQKRDTSFATMAEFRRIQNGMSYQQVCNIIGSEGELLSENFMEGVPGVMASIHTEMFMWQGEGLGNMNAMFQNDKLMQKSQFGLK
jgi:hypothetical protein